MGSDLGAARDRIERDYAQPLTIVGLARTAHRSPWHFIRAFRQAYGVTPGQCLRARRLERARELLTTTPLPVTEVCELVGYRGLATFSRVFRQATGTSPTAYRRLTRRPVYIPGCFLRMYRVER
jgi:transcriptional regulator GlxA family with amidase domain